MRKIALFLAALLAVSLVGCSKQTDNEIGDITNVSSDISEPQPQFSREGDFIRTDNKNLYEMNFAELGEQLEEIIGAKDNKISMPFMYDLPAVDIFFTPSGEIMNFKAAFRALSSENDSEFIISQYTVENNTNMTGYDVHLQEKDNHFLKWVFENDFAFEKFPAFTKWATDFDFEKVIQQYSVGEPVRYEFLAGVSIQREIIDNENISCVFLDCSSGTPVQVQYEDLPYSEKGIGSFEPTHNIDDRTQYLEYYVILPYYSADEVSGYPPLYVYMPPDNAENREAYYANPNAYTVGGEKYSINNVIVLFPNGI